MSAKTLLLLHRTVAPAHGARAVSNAASAILPTRHSLSQPKRLCEDSTELKDRTAALLGTTVGKLYSADTRNTTRAAAYYAANESIQLAEYLVLGHARNIPGSLYADHNAGSDDPLTSLTSMKSILNRMQNEGAMFMELRNENILQQLASEEHEETEPPSFLEDFAPPAATGVMYDAVLDAMACTKSGGPMEYLDLATTLIHRYAMDEKENAFTIPTMVTYNAPLRGVALLDIQDQVLRDEAMRMAFTLYNSLTHSELAHIQRNPRTMTYMCRILDKCIPGSRVKGNMSVTFFSHATQLGILDEAVIDALRQIHSSQNGPEFQILLDHLSGDLPQRFRRFVNKYNHSEHY